MGLGGSSCGQDAPLEEDRIKAGNHMMGFIIRPAGNDLTQRAKVSAAGEMPLGMSRDRAGMLKITTARKNAVICYSINDSKKVFDYKEPFDLREGGKVTAWYKDNEQLRVTFEFNKIESIPV